VAIHLTLPKTWLDGRVAALLAMTEEKFVLIGAPASQRTRQGIGLIGSKCT
jgi:hypothetical protein